MNRIVNITFLLSLLTTCGYGQWADYTHERALTGMQDQWHSITIPPDVFGKASDDLHDLRILGVNSAGDTLEAPYLLRVKREETLTQAIDIEVLNSTFDERGYYFTFALPTVETVNRIELDFQQQNFDWQVRLEGSNDQTRWFTLVDDYRILAIRNKETDFQYTTLEFLAAKYRYLRLAVDASEQPTLNAAHLAEMRSTPGTYYTYTLRSVNVEQDKEARKTEIIVELPKRVPVSRLQLEVLDDFDYYRPVSVQYLRDSIQTPKGWKYNYRNCYSGTLNSLSNADFRLPQDVVTHQLKILISNDDNHPLSFGEMTVQGYEYELVARFTDPAAYSLVYGHHSARRPRYDLDHFTDKIPTAPVALKLGQERSRPQSTIADTAASPLFTNKVWLWALMLVIIAVLGWGALRMMKEG